MIKIIVQKIHRIKTTVSKQQAAQIKQKRSIAETSGKQSVLFCLVSSIILVFLVSTMPKNKIVYRWV